MTGRPHTCSDGSTMGRHVSNWDLWQQLREAVSAWTALTAFKHVYSHVGVVGTCW